MKQILKQQKAILKSNLETEIEIENANKVFQSIKVSKVIWAVLIGLGFVIYLIWKQFDINEFNKIQWTGRTLLWLGVAVIILAFRHFCYMARLYILTEGAFSWKKCFDLIFIWEFSSAVTPTSVGGSAVALFVLSQENISTAKTATIVIYTVILDGLFFLIGIPIFYMLFGDNIVPPDEARLFGSLGTKLVLLITYIIMFTYTILLIWGIFINPKRIRSFFLFICKLPFLNRFQEKAAKLGDDILLASKEVKTKPLKYHLGAFTATTGAWTGKFLLILAIIIALVPTFQAETALLVLLFAKLKMMFVLILLFPSPGGAGFAELAFGAFMHGYIPKTFSLVIALLWRILSYYSYLIAGAIIIPTWIRNRIEERKNE
jgi:uncharacterized protein (TIRG00374 family)